MKRWVWLQVLAALFALGLLVPAKAEAQIPVTDVASFTEQVKTRLQTVLKLYQQYMQMKLQYDMAVDSYNALVGARRISDIFDNPALRAYLPEDWVEMYDDVKNAGYNARSQSMQNIYASYHAFDRCAYLKDKDEKLTCEALAIQAAAKKGLIVPAAQMIGKRSLQIKALMKALEKSKDMKEAETVQGRIDAEQAYIANTQSELEIHRQAAEAEKELLEQRKREELAEPWARTGGIVPAPASF
jgi:type IV secretion system protein VirB5